jgi:hypothetical protein
MSDFMVDRSSSCLRGEKLFFMLFVVKSSD